MEIKKVIEESLKTLYKEDRYLIEEKAHEQDVCAHLMCYIKQELKKEGEDFWNVDVEYNRQGEDRDAKKDNEGRTRKIDIAIHQRGPNGHNLALILAKGRWNREDRENDRSVALSLKEKHGYENAFLVEFEEEEGKLIEL